MTAGVLTSQFVADNGMGSRLIQYLTEGSVSHVDLVLPSGELLGARLSGGVAVRRPDYGKFTRIVRVSCTVPNLEAAYEFAMRQVGKPYNKGAIVDMALHRERPFTPFQNSWFCDELNYEIYLAGGVQLLNTLNPLWLTPEMELLSNVWLTKTTIKWGR